MDPEPGTTNIEMYPEALTAAGDLTANLAADVRAVFKNLRTKLTSIEVDGNQPWGDDEMGHKFTDGPGYHGSRDNLLSGGDSIADHLDEFAVGMHDAVDVLTSIDYEAADLMPVQDVEVPHKLGKTTYLAE